MTLDAVHSAIRLRFENEWPWDDTPVQYPLVKFTPPDNGPWVRLAITDADANWASMGDPGNNILRNVGQVVVQIFVLSGTGEGEALQRAESAMSIFRSWTDATTGLRFEVPPYARQIGIDGKWYQVNVVAPFRYDDFF